MVDKSKFENQQMLGMKISIYGKSVLVTDAMKNHAIEKISKIERLNDHILDIHVYLDIQRVEHHASIVAHFSHFKVKVEAITTDMYASIDKAVDKLQSSLRKWKGKIQDYHRKNRVHVPVAVNVYEKVADDEIEEFNEAIESSSKKKVDFPKVTATEKHMIKTLNVNEALMKLDLSKDLFLVYRSEEDQKLKVMYRRSDGNYGLIHAEG